MPKTIASMKKRLEQALQRADEAEDLVEMMKEAIAAYGLAPGDLFTEEELKGAAAAPSQRKTAAYMDEAGNTWTGRGRRPLWLVDALAEGASLEDFRNPSFRG